MNFGAYDYAKKDLNELPLRREVLYPAELLAHILLWYCTEKNRHCQ